MSGDQIPLLPGKERRQMPGVCPGGDVEASIGTLPCLPLSCYFGETLLFCQYGRG